jgi:hypothetical protein
MKTRTVIQWLNERIESEKPLNDSYTRRVLKTAERYGLDITLKQARGHGDRAGLKLLPKARQVPITARFTEKEKLNYEIGRDIINEARRVKAQEGRILSFDQIYTQRHALPIFPKEADKRVIKGMVRSALTKDGYVKDHDFLEHTLKIHDSKGSYWVTVRGSKKRSLIGQYHNAVKHYRLTGDASELKKFKGKSFVDVYGKKHYFLTSTRILDRLIEFGDTDFLELYVS